MSSYGSFLKNFKSRADSARQLKMAFVAICSE